MNDSPDVETPAPTVEAPECPSEPVWLRVERADVAAIEARLSTLESEAKHWLGNRAAGLLRHVEAIRELLP